MISARRQRRGPASPENEKTPTHLTVMVQTVRAAALPIAARMIGTIAITTRVIPTTLRRRAQAVTPLVAGLPGGVAQSRSHAVGRGEDRRVRRDTKKPTLARYRGASLPLHSYLDGRRN
jgi:hypothetical protein